jgi:hypothetical protein
LRNVIGRRHLVAPQRVVSSVGRGHRLDDFSARRDQDAAALAWMLLARMGGNRLEDIPADVHAQ